MRKLLLLVLIGIFGTGCSPSAEERGKRIGKAYCTCIEPVTSKVYELTKGQQVDPDAVPEELSEEYEKTEWVCLSEMVTSLEGVIRDYETNEANQKQFLFAYNATMTYDSPFSEEKRSTHPKDYELTFNQLKSMVLRLKEMEKHLSEPDHQ